MSKTIAAVPESITREAYLALIEGAGFEDVASLRSLRFTPDGIYAEAYAPDPAGGFMLDGTEDGEHPGFATAAVHTVYIPVEG